MKKARSKVLLRNMAIITAALTAAAAFISAALAEGQSMSIFAAVPMIRYFSIMRICLFIGIALFAFGFITDKMVDHPKIFTALMGVLNIPYVLFFISIVSKAASVDLKFTAAVKVILRWLLMGTVQTGAFLTAAAFVYCIILCGKVKRSMVNPTKHTNKHTKK